MTSPGLISFGLHTTQTRFPFWWRDVLKLTPIYRGISKVEVNRGDKILMWKDLWLDQPLADSHPRAFSFANNEGVSVQNFLLISSLDEAFQLPLSVEAHAEVHDIQCLVANIVLNDDPATRDFSSYSWGSTEYTA